MTINRDSIMARIKAEEGFTQVSLWDRKQWTWGYGTAAPGPDFSITPQEAEIALGVAVDDAIRFVDKQFPGVDLSEKRAEALVDMTYNLGAPTFLEFKHMIAAIRRNDWCTAAAEARLSHWYYQVGARANRIVSELIHG